MEKKKNYKNDLEALEPWSSEQIIDLKCNWHKLKGKTEKRKEIQKQIRQLRDLKNYPFIKLSSSVDDLLQIFAGRRTKGI